MPMPALPDITRMAGRKFAYFGESRGHLHLIENYGTETVRLNVYEMERDRSCWFVKYCVDLERLTTEFPQLVRSEPTCRRFFYGFRVLCVVRALDEEESYMVVHVPGKAIRCRLKDGSFMCVDDISHQGRLKHSWSNAHRCFNCGAEADAEPLLPSSQGESEEAEDWPKEIWRGLSKERCYTANVVRFLNL